MNKKLAMENLIADLKSEERFDSTKIMYAQYKNLWGIAKTNLRLDLL